MPIKEETRILKFWGMVAKGNGCWEWQGKCNGTGYGILRARGKVNYRAHRFSWELVHGPIPPGMCVCHSCDNPKCVRPDHLFLGTNSDNMRDCARKGRMHLQRHPEKALRGDAHPMRRSPERAARGDRNGMRTHPGSVLRGEKSPAAKVTNEIAARIKERYAAGGVSQRALAAEAGLTQRAVWAIVHGQTYAA